MSMTYRGRKNGRALWAGLAISIAVHGGVLAAALSPRAASTEQIVGLKGRELIDLADVEMVLGAPESDLPEGAPSAHNKAVMDSPEVVEMAKASNDPLLAQIPYQVDDPELQFRVANPDQNTKSQEDAAEVPTEIKEETSEVSSPDSVAAAPEASAGQDEASQSAEAEEGLSDDAAAEITAWQKQLVLTLAGAKTYPKAGRKARAEGEVVVAFSVDRYGRVRGRTVTKSSGYPVLDAAALQVIDGFDRLPTPPNVMGAGPFDLSIPFNYRIK